MKTLAELVLRFCELVGEDHIHRALGPDATPTDCHEVFFTLRDMREQARRDAAFAERAKVGFDAEELEQICIQENAKLIQ